MARQCAPWYPTVFPDLCDGCKGRGAPRCVEFCPNNVFEFATIKLWLQGPTIAFMAVQHVSRSALKSHNFPQRQTLTTTRKDRGLLRKVKCNKCGKTF